MDFTEEKTDVLLSILSGLPDAMIIINKSGNIILVNKQAEALFGYKQENLLDKPIEKLMPERYRNNHTQHRISYFMQPRTRPMGSGLELLGLRSDGEEFPVEISLAPVETEDGIITLAAIRNISDRKKLEKTKNEFIALVSHELRTPLTSIYGAISLIDSMQTDKNGEISNLIAVAKRNSERLIRLVNNLLDIEKIEAGKMEFHFQPFEIDTLIKEIVEENLNYAAKFSIKLKVLNNVSKIKVYIDKDKFNQAITNLLSNAVKFSPKNAEVLIETFLLNDRTVRISIKDQGEGIPKEFVPKIFEKFTQAKKNNEVQPGTGLGLSITKAIIEKFKGKINFETRENNGTTFYFDLPVWSENKSKIQHFQSHKHPTVLIFEPQLEIMELIGSILKPEFNYESTSDIEEVKKILLEKKFDALILDLDLTYKQNIAFFSEIRKIFSLEGLPIIIFSLKENALNGYNELSGGAFNLIDYIEKPIGEARLRQAIAQLKTKIKKEQLQILYVEEDADLVATVALILENEGVISNAKTIKYAIEELLINHFDLAILDLNLPDGSGIELIPYLSQFNIPILIYTAYDNELKTEYSSQIKDILIKSKTSNEKLIQTVHAALCRKK